MCIKSIAPHPPLLDQSRIQRLNGFSKLRRGYAPLLPVKADADRPSLQREIDRDRHDDRHGDAVEQRRRELPLLDCVERRLVEQRNRPQNFGVLDPAVGADGRLDDDDALHAGGLGDRRIDRIDVLASWSAP